MNQSRPGDPEIIPWQRLQRGSIGFSWFSNASRASHQLLRFDGRMWISTHKIAFWMWRDVWN
jgi:hypothetical protein